MISEIIIDEEIENVYNLDSIGLQGELVLSKNNKYIVTNDDYFPINSIEDFKLIGNDYIITNEISQLKIPQEKFEILMKLF